MSERDVREKGEKIFLSQREKERGVKGESVSMIRKKANVKLVSGHWLFKKFAFEFSSRLLQSFFCQLIVGNIYSLAKAIICIVCDFDQPK